MATSVPPGDFPSLGIDVGSVSVSCVLARVGGDVVRHLYRFHGGKPRETLAAVLREIAPPSPVFAALTATSPRLLSSAAAFDSQVCLITAGRRLMRGVGALLFVGGERFGLIRFDADGNYSGTRINSSCAAMNLSSGGAPACHL